MTKLKIVIAASVAVALVGALLVGCGGNSSNGTDALGVDNGLGAALSLDMPLVKTNQSTNAARLLTQATFGPTHADMANLTALPDIETWIDQQINLPATLQLPEVQAFGNASLRPPRHYVWWDTVINANDQLRQRVAFALSEIFVVSDIDYTLGNSQHGVVSFYDLLAAHAFGNFRELLGDVTLHPVMGIYLSMVRNEKADAEKNIRPDENYAREIMQLFTIGLYELDAGGTPVPVDNPKPAYSQSTVEEYARVFTGWNFADSPEWQSTNLTSYDKISPMVPQEQFHDNGSKQLLGGVVAPAGLSMRDDLNLALDSLFNHPNVGPFIGKALIQRLVTSNPSTDYVARVGAAFNDNGEGVRGDMAAVIKAILLDTEARQSPSMQSADFGKFKEPLLRVTHMLRALNAVPGARSDGRYHLFSKTSDVADDILGQAVQSSPSVFNFFSPTFRSSQVIAGQPDNPLYAPELQILTESLVSAANNDFHSLIYEGNNRSDTPSRASMISLDEPVMFLKEGSSTYLEHMNMLLFSGTMSPEMQAVLADYIADVVVENSDAASDANAESEGEGATDDGSNAENELADDFVDQQLATLDDALLETIAVDSIFMMLSSPEYLVQR